MKRALQEEEQVNTLERNVDDILDDVIRDAAPEIVRDIREREVDEDIDEFIDGALHGSWDSKDLDYPDPPKVGSPTEVMDAGDNEEVTEMYRLGYKWGWDNPAKIKADQPPPAAIRAEMIEYALENFKSRVTEEFVINAIEKATGYVKQQMGDVHNLLKKAKEKFGWKIAPAIVGIEVFEHAVLPTALGAIHPIFYGLAAVPTIEILAASALAIAKARMPASAPIEIPPGHLDWYEEEYQSGATNESLLRLYIRDLLSEVNEYEWNKADRKTMGQDGKAKGRQKKNWVGQNTNDVITNWYKKMGLAEAIASPDNIGHMNPDVVHDQLSKPIEGPYFRQTGETYLSQILDQIEAGSIHKAALTVMEALWIDDIPIDADEDLEAELSSIQNEDDLAGVVAEWVPRYWKVNDMGKIMGRL